MKVIFLYLLFLLLFPITKKENRRWRDELIKVSDFFQLDTNDIVKTLKRGRWNPYQGYLITEKFPFKHAVVLAEQKDKFPYLFYQQVPIRKYLAGERYSHITGYIRRINEKEYQNRKQLDYSRDSIIGVMGIERQYDINLRGKDGYKIQIVDARHRIKEIIEPENGESQPGNNVYLTIDSRMQRIVEDMMQGYSGGAIITRPSTGEILALHSYPSYDPNIFVGKLDIKTFKKYQSNEEKPFYNRVIQGLYPPSSIYKVVVSSAGLRGDSISFYNKKYFCQGSVLVGNQYFKCTGWHKNQNMLTALANSCNSYFYKMGIEIGSRIITDMSSKYFNLGKKTGIDLPFEKAGRIPTHRWKREKIGSFWWDGDTANLSIGQGFLLTTVLQLNSVISAFANANGIAYRPYLLDKIINVNNDQIVYQQEKYPFINLPLEDKDILRIQKALREVSIWGTASSATKSPIKIAGKTGTAQNIQGVAHAWFSCYAPYNSKKIEDRIAVTVFIEHGLSGGATAAPFATAIIESIFLGTDVKTVYKRIMQASDVKSSYYEDWLKKRNEKKLDKNTLKILLKQI